MKHRHVVPALILVALAGCASEPALVNENFKFNQLGFLPKGEKIAVIPAGEATEFVLTTRDGTEVYKGALSEPRYWPYSGEQVQVADFSAYTGSGNFRLRAGTLPPTPVFRIGPEVYRGLHAATLKAFYYNRSAMELKPEYAGRWARPGAHPDTHVIVHSSAASEGRPAGALIASPGGWYDAGDFNKYIVNSAITVYTLLAAYEHFPAYYQAFDVNIPESGNGQADILDEALYNLRWMLTMQDPADGGVYHKLTGLKFEDALMPHEDKLERYVVQKSTGAALDLAAVGAVCHRIFAVSDPALSAKCLRAAAAAWNWALKNPRTPYVQPADVKTGTYAPGSEDFKDEFAWAAAELFIATGDARYIKGIDFAAVPVGVPSWGWVSPLAWISLAQHADKVKSKIPAELIRAKIRETADLLKNQYDKSAYRIVMGAFGGEVTKDTNGLQQDFVWGSNGVAANQGLMLIQAYRLLGDRAYLDAATANLDYLLGRNPLGLSYVTGWGTHHTRNIHHRVSESDGIEESVPGFLAGGPHSGQQDAADCLKKQNAPYPSKLPALSYLDRTCSYASNEVAINWNAALVYLIGAVESLHTSQ
ncbi:MAG TPA: glycoside hydrolase family 9 protein [Gammaproteobacteria bacterium]|nr:glycoside hydrolase family 9 protein [Gammaproteobacteria bacterium]